MNHKLKALGLALFAVLAMGGLSASAASAANFHSEVAHTILTGSQIGEDKFTVNAGTVTCSEATYAGTQSVVTTETISVVPTYSGCKAFGFVNTTIDTNGCSYQFHAANNKVDILCPAGKTIVVTAFNCEVTVPEQLALASVTYDNTNAGSARDVDVTVSITGITYIQHSKSFPGCNANETKLRHDGVYTGAATVRGFTTEGKQVGVFKS